MHRLGVGAMRLAAEPDGARSASMELLRCAVELGVTLIDTAHLYGWGANEELIAEALHPYPEELLVPVHCIDPAIPLADQVGVLADLRDEGKIGHIGLSEVSAAQLAEVRETVDIAGVQNRYNILDREHDPVVDACEQACIAFLPWRPVVAGTAGATAVIAVVARELDATATQVVLAWLLRRSRVIAPIPGTASLGHLTENLTAAGVEITDDQYERLDRIAAPKVQ